MSKAALWLRVSTDEQTTENQRAALATEAQRRGLEVVWLFDVTASGYRGEQERTLSDLITGAQRREYDTVLIWALDRLDRRGTLATLTTLDRLFRAGCRVVSLTEPWLEADGPTRELLISVMAWVARQESARRSERIRAGLARRRAQGLWVGRKPGARDLAPRRRAGYVARYDREGRRGRAKQATSRSGRQLQASGGVAKEQQTDFSYFAGAREG